jgi:hypothetical protein
VLALGQLSAGHGVFSGELPEQLLDEERRAFIGIRERYASIKDGRLVMSVTLSRPLRKEVAASLYVFGYRRDVPFSQMPKLHVKFGQSDYRVYDGDSLLAAEEVAGVAFGPRFQARARPRELRRSLPRVSSLLLPCGA